MLVVGEYLVREFVGELIEAEINLGLDFIVQKLFLEFVQGVKCRIVVQIQWIQHTLHHGRIFSSQYMVCGRGGLGLYGNMAL